LVARSDLSLAKRLPEVLSHITGFVLVEASLSVYVRLGAVRAAQEKVQLDPGRVVFRNSMAALGANAEDE
jgi:hypothetical protein